MTKGISATEEGRFNKLADGIATLLGGLAADAYSQEGDVGRGVSDSLQFGGRFPAFLQMYVDKHVYCGIKEGPYAAFSEAVHEADRQLLPAIVKQIKERGIRTVYSLGPTPELDAELLKMLAEQNIPVRYVAVDISPSTLFKAKDKISDHIGTHRGSEVTLDEILGSFESISSSEKSLVIMTGVTVSNYPDSLWEVAARIARPGGLVIADSGTTPEHSRKESAYWKKYWMSMYNAPAHRKMLMNGLEQLLPDIFTPENRHKWQLRVRYVPRTGSEQWRERPTTPRIQDEVRVNNEMDVRWAGREYRLMPSQTIVPVVSCKPDSLSFLTKASEYGLNPVAAKEYSVNYSIEGGPKAGAISALFVVK
ncbi:class I SAM-dependent methyltransferase [Candidatus Woesearchaeota archaeon]|nr:class I SAM-dependent methyltransferase [Candidatus Woesearchaeota archaeon]